MNNQNKYKINIGMIHWQKGLSLIALHLTLDKDVRDLSGVKLLLTENYVISPEWAHNVSSLSMVI